MMDEIAITVRGQNKGPHLKTLISAYDVRCVGHIEKKFMDN
jgi:hypothetical protein